MNPFEPTQLPGVMVITPRIFRDARGYFLETFHEKRYQEQGILPRMVQDNQSVSKKGVLRGLHYQLANPQAKLVSVCRGEIFDVAVDIRRGSPTFGRWVGVGLSDRDHRQIFIPAGFAHGFCTLSDEAVVNYKCSDFYTPGDEYGVLWNDPTAAVDWPVAEPELSDKDLKLPELMTIPAERLPSYTP